MFRTIALGSRLLLLASVIVPLSLAKADEHGSTRLWPPPINGGSSTGAAAESRTASPPTTGPGGGGARTFSGRALRLRTTT